jgi:hypothetical protein
MNQELALPADRACSRYWRNSGGTTKRPAAFQRVTLTELGKPVILIYLGFVACNEMQDGTDQTLIADDDAWQKMVEDHSRSLFPREVWNKKWHVHGQSFIPLVRTYDQPLSAGKTARV